MRENETAFMFAYKSCIITQTSSQHKPLIYFVLKQNTFV